RSGRCRPRHEDRCGVSEENVVLGGRYRLGRILGTGGMAEVFLAEDTRLHRTVAVKVLRSDLARDSSFQERFRREAHSAAALNHPSIVAVYDTGAEQQSTLNEAGAVKVMDFGIARAIAAATSAMTATQAVMGTAQYLSPEQARGQLVDARSDIYSAACVMFEMLTGRPPFTGDTPVSIAYQHV